MGDTGVAPRENTRNPVQQGPRKNDGKSTKSNRFAPGGTICFQVKSLLLYQLSYERMSSLLSRLGLFSFPRGCHPVTTARVARAARWRSSLVLA